MSVHEGGFVGEQAGGLRLRFITHSFYPSLSFFFLGAEGFLSSASGLL